ncbi:UBX domain-containing protein 7-like [Artemia franciscana]|uniref:UBX domain-containing protein n=1 Tax=Artemia franciscana TaxID=6661 RepID=A0AA88IGH6_ARTSF|nr:hypothetical protein QYM36_003653 [Artemia franciscana]
MADNDRSNLLSQFMAVTGCSSEELAKNFLDACSYNLEMAINMFLEGGDEARPQGPSTGSEEVVRAPIPHKQETLVEQEVLTFGFRGKPRKRAATSVFDTFRDFQAETRLQEAEVKRNGSANGCSSVESPSKRKTLEDLFRPPFDLMHRGTFQSARDAGVALNKWLLVNVQDAAEFTCQTLNRDVWSNSAVKAIVREHFIFWQVYISSEEGGRYKTFYPVTKYPYVSIIDPVTGESLTVWHSLDAVTFCDLTSTFLENHIGGPLPGAGEGPQKRRKMEAIVDADEETQFKAAIKASLVESQSKVESDSESEIESFSDDSKDVANLPPVPVETSSKSDLEKPELKVDDKSWEDYLGSPEDPKSRLVIRFPEPLNSREQLVVPCSSTFMLVLRFMESKGFHPKSYELRTSFPIRVLSPDDRSKTLKEMGLFPQETVFVNAKD